MAGSFLAYTADGGDNGSDDGWDPPIAVGEVAVVDASRLNCRVGPGLDYAVDHVMNAGEAVVVLDGPVHADGYHWYKLSMENGERAWAIGEGLAPAGTGASFAEGDAVRVFDGPLNLRTAPGLDAPIRRVLDDNEALLIREGPVWTDGYTWYRVRNYAGEGWAAGEFLRFDPNGFPPEEGA